MKRPVLSPIILVDKKQVALFLLSFREIAQRLALVGVMSLLALSAMAQPSGASVSSGAPYCPNGSITVGFTTANWTNNSVAHLDLMASDGVTVVQNDIGSTYTTDAPAPTSLSGTLPGSVSFGTQYRLRVRVTDSSPNTGDGTTNTALFTITTPTINTPTVTPAGPYCPGDMITVSFTTGGCPFPGGNVFTVQLDDNAGFSSPVNLTPTGASSPLVVTIPSNTEPGSNYRVRVVASNPNTVQSSGSTTFRVRTPGFTNALPLTLCQGAGYDLTFNTFSSQTFNPGNKFIAEIGTVSGTTFTAVAPIGYYSNSALINVNSTQTIKAVIPFNLPSSGPYYLRWRSTTMLDTSCYTGPYTVPQIRQFTDPTNDFICSGSANFSVTNVPASGGAVTYQWYQSNPILFSMKTSGLASISVNSIAKSGMNVYAATGTGLSISTDGGLTYSSTVLGAYFISNVVVSGGSVYAATNNGLYKLDLAGAIQTHYTTAGPFFLPNLNVLNVLVDGADIYVCTSNGLAKSTGGGPFVLLDSSPAFDVFVDGSYIYLATSAGVKVSQNGGASFTTYTTMHGLGSNNVQSIFVQNNIVYAGTDFGLSYSTNGGTEGALSFVFTTKGLPGNNVRDIFAATGGAIYVATTGGFAIGSRGFNDSGAPLIEAFSPVIAGLTNPFVTGIIIEPSQILLATLGGVAISPFTFSAGSNTSTQMVSATPDNSLRRFQALVLKDGCFLGSNPVRIADIPPIISVLADSTYGPPVCGGTTGRIYVQGLIPNTKYRLNFTNGPSPGMPKNGDTITVDAKGYVGINLLAAGTYHISFNSLVEPPANGCVSNLLMVTISDPTKPGNPMANAVAPVCQGTNIVVNLTSSLSATEEYRWFKDAAGTMPHNPSVTITNTYSPAAFPLTSGTLYVAKRDKVTQCNSLDTLDIPYTVNTAPVITCMGDDVALTITISGLTAGNYTLAYSGPAVGNPAPGPVVVGGSGQIVITGLAIGNYSGIQVTNAAGCPSNLIGSCPLFGPPADDAIGANKLQTIKCGIPAVAGGYYQKAPSGNGYETGLGVAVGRIRQTNDVPANPNENVELRGWLRFDLNSHLPSYARIDRVEYQPVSVEGPFTTIADVPIRSATGDIQFDITQISQVNYPLPAGFSPAAFADLADTKYADFTISHSVTGPFTDLGPQGVTDLQSRLLNDGIFQLGLTLSGTDFDVPLYQFHGIVFDEASAAPVTHQLCVTYHIEDFGDLPEPKYATDLAGGLVGPSHRIDSIDVDTRPTVDVRRPALYIGATPPDAESNGQESANSDGDDTNGDDEDLAPASFSAALIAGTTVNLTVPVTNFLPRAAAVSVFIDWNNDGVFSNTTERIPWPVLQATLPGAPGMVTPYTANLVIPVNVPIDLTTATVGVRVRITSAGVFDAYGPAPDGEVEDFLVEVRGLDFGDLPDPANGTATNDFRTRFADDGARHAMVLAAPIYLGQTVDAEADGQASANGDGDDLNPVPSVDDEDGVVFQATPLIPGQVATVTVTARNGHTTDPARLYLYADFNNDGLSSLLPVTFLTGDPVFLAGVTDTRVYTFLMPLNAAYMGDKAFFRFRFTTQALANDATGAYGLAQDGEVEDYISGDISLYDWADLPEPIYNTDKDGGVQGPSHRITAVHTGGGVYRNGLFIGATVPDMETDGQPHVSAAGDDNVMLDDEDLSQNDFTNLLTSNQLIAGNTITLTVPYVNITGVNAKMIAFIDWNADGDFEDTGERIEQDANPADPGVVTFLNIPIPDWAGSPTTAVRIRLTTGVIFDSNGPAPDGEVEDFFVNVIGYDYGDLPDNDISAIPTGSSDIGPDLAKGDYHTYFTTDGNRGPRHLTNPDLKIGNTVDAEGNGQPQVNAVGDDINGIDDEDGVIQPDSVVRGKPAVFKVFVTNKTGADAYLHAFVDWNDDGDFLDIAPGENEHVGPIVVASGASGTYFVTFIVPVLPNPLPERVAARFRLSNTNYDLSTGPALVNDINGEVEDMWVSIVGYDWGDLPEPRYITNSLGGQQGASHKIATTDHDNNPGTVETFALFIGATPPDPEPDGQPHAQAFGDDENGVPDDEDLSSVNFVNAANVQDSIVAGEFIRLRVPVVNNYVDSTATLWAFIDWNGDGAFTGPEETRQLPVPSNGGATQFINFDYNTVPPIAEPDSIGVRIRLTTSTLVDAYGIALDGEVEDFIVELKSRDFGDLPDLTANAAKDDFQTLDANEGPRHAIPVIPLVYLGSAPDTEADGQPSGTGNGDDANPLQADDEDGIIFLTPMEPGNTAQLAFYATNNSPAAARLHIWADWDNDGILSPVTVVNAVDLDLAANTSIASNAKRIITFQVPMNATFDGGKVHFRFRISSHPDFLAAPSPLGLAQNGEVEDYVVPLFKIGSLVWEDRNHNGFQDAEEINLGIDSVRVVMRFGGIDPTTGACDSVTQNTITDLNTLTRDARPGDQITDYVIDTLTSNGGQYIFVGMIEGFYQVIAADTFGLTPTRFDWIKNVTEEDRDSDGKPYRNPWEYANNERRQSKSQEWKLLAATIGTDEEGILDQRNPFLPDPNEHGDPFPDNRVEQRIDFGYTAFDFGDLDSSLVHNPSVSHFNTEEDGIGNHPEGPKHIVTPDLRLGRCQDAEWEGQPDQDAGAEFKPGADLGGDDPIASFSTYPTFPYDPSQGRRWPFNIAANACGDDEDGIRFNTPMVAGYDAQISVRYNAKLNLDGPDAYLHAWFDWNGDGDFYVNGNPAMGIDPDEHVIFTALDGGAISLEPITKAVELEMSYLTSPDDSIRLTFKVPAHVKYNNGNMLTRFRISFDPRLGPDGILDASINFPNALGLNFPNPQPGAGTSQVPGGVVPYGEVEDYFIALSKVGNLVWEDRDYDGIQDVLEPPIANVPIRLEFAGIDGIFGTAPTDPFEYVYHDTTDANGIYYFCGLIGNVDPSGIPNPTYRLVVSDPDDMTSTFNNPDPSDDSCIDNNSNGDDELIDGEMLTIGGMTKFERVTMDTFSITNPMMLCVDEDSKYDVGNPPAAPVPGSPLPPSPDALNNFPDNQYDETRDFGYSGFDYGDLPIASVKAGSNYPTLRDSMDGQFTGKFGARHVIQPRLYLGKGVDAELNGQPDNDAGSKAGGDDDDQSKFVKGDGTDDESGVLLLSPLLPGERAFIKVNYTSQDTTTGSYVNKDAYLTAFIDWNGDGDFVTPLGAPDDDEWIVFTHKKASGANFNIDNIADVADVKTMVLNPTGTTGVDSVILGFNVPNHAVFDSGVVYMRFRLSWTNYETQFPIAFPNGLGPDNNKFHMPTSPFVKSYEPFGDGVNPNDPDNVGRFPYPVGEVEDYGIPVAKIGNLAWYDHDVFGDQDATGEEGVDTMHLVLVWGGIDPATGQPDTVGYQTPEAVFANLSKGAVSDILYNRTLIPPTAFPANTYTPEGGIKKTGVSTENAVSGMYSFRGLIPGRYYVIPEKYLQRDSTSFVDFWPKHRVLTLQDNPGVDDNNDSDGIDITGATAGQVSKGPGAFVRINDGNAKYPEVCVNDRPLNENGLLMDAVDDADPDSKAYFPDEQWDKSIDFGWIDEPNIEANLDIVGVDFSTSQECKHLNVIMHLCIKNPTEVPLDSFMMALNLKQAYGDAFVGNVEVSIVDSAFTTSSGNTKVKKSMTGAVSALTPFINPNYNGDSNINLFNTIGSGGQTWNDGTGPGSFYLPGDSVICVRIEFEIDGDKTATLNANTPQGWYSQAQVWARAVGFNKATGKKRPVLDFRFFDPFLSNDPGDAFVVNPRFGQPIQVMDWSDEFDDPMPMAGLVYPDGGDGILFEGMVADRGANGEYKTFPIPPSVTGRDKYLDEDDRTIQNDQCWIRTRLNSGIKDINISMDNNCEAIINADQLVPNFLPECGFDKYPEGSYYRVIIQDEHTGETIWASVDRVPFDAAKYLKRKLIYKVRSVANHCEPVWGRLNLEDKTVPVVTCPVGGLTVDRRVSADSKTLIGPRPFVCTDIDSVLNKEASWKTSSYAYFTGIASATDSCGTVYLDRVSDAIHYVTDCAITESNRKLYAYIIRTFFFRDEFGNEGICQQRINFIRPTIVLPECKVEVLNVLAKGDTLLKPADLLSKYGLSESVPYFLNAAGTKIYITQKEYCGFSVDYVDENVYTTGQCGRKIIRKWSIFDWCYGTGTNYPTNFLQQPTTDNDCYANAHWEDKIYCWEQLLVIGDDAAPIVLIPDIDKDGFKGSGYNKNPDNKPNPKVSTATFDAQDVYEFSTGAMDCTGAFRFTKDMLQVTNKQSGSWCFNLAVLVRRPVLDLDERPTGQFTLKPDPTILVLGDCDKGFNIAGVPMPKDTNTFWFLEIRVFDACYQDTTIYVPFRIVDKIAPVMKCDDKLNLTLDNEGVGNIAAKEVDEGSWDNCGKIEWMKVRRPIGTCSTNFMALKRFVDVNKNGKIDADIDYIDENRNFKAEDTEYFRINKTGGALMSPMLDTVPVFCCDGDSIMIELWGADKSGNRNFCWNWIRLEDKTGLEYLMPFPQTYKCTEERDRLHLLSIAGTYAENTDTYKAAIALLKGDVTIIRGAFCTGVTREIVISPSLHCDAGEISITWKLTKPTAHGPQVTTTVPVKITVQAVHEYNLTFPADVKGSCGAIADTANVVDGGELACDVLAVLVQDKRYDSTTDEFGKYFCYKVFRTFTVINWCQYDESCGEPMQWAVIVPRDPDNNGYNGVNVLVRDQFGGGQNTAVPGTGLFSGSGMDGWEEIYYEDACGNGKNFVAESCERVMAKGNHNDKSRLFWYNNSGQTVCSNTANYGNTGNEHFAWMFTQHIYVLDETPPVVEDPGTLVFYQNKNTCDGAVTIPITASDSCASTEIQQTPSVLGNLAVERIRISVNGAAAAELSTLPAAYGVTVTPASGANAANSWTFSGKFPLGNHKLYVIVRDDCGNLSATREIPFSVVDTNGTPPICYHGLSTALMKNPTTGEGEMLVWASDFVASPVDDCNGQGPETGPTGKKIIKKYYVVKDNGDGIWTTADGLNEDGIPIEPATSVTFDCDDAKISQVNIRLYSLDEKGNWAWCETYALITDPSKICAPVAASAAIAGAIATEAKINVEGAQVTLSGQAQQTNLTNANGQFSFNNLTLGYDYSVTPHLDKDYLNGVSTFDLVLITKHILGVQPLNTPYKLIAADINNSKTVTTLDLIQLRKLILGIDAKYANNTSWRFVDASYKFPNAANPWQAQFPEVANINDLAGNVTANFVAVKIGDVNGNALANSVVRTSGAFGLNVEDQKMKAGNEYRVAFSGDLSQIEGYQFTLGFDRNAVELVNVEQGLAKEDNFGIFAKDGLITTSWNEAQGTGLRAQGETLFTLVLKAKVDATLSEVLNVNSRITRAEAYRAGGDFLSVSLNFGNSAFAQLRNFELMQNVPNPFQGETMIGFVLPEAGDATLTIQDVTGRTLRMVRGDFAQGYNQVILKANELNATGVLYYTLKSGDYVATKKMIILE
jgi:hypothetical protein